MWDLTLQHFPTFREHFSNPLTDTEAEARVRFLVAAECAFVEQEISTTLAVKPTCSMADIGDSDGSVRLVMEQLFGKDRLRTVGINLQASAVERMRRRGLEAICADAIEVGNHGTSYDVVSLFETMEHLPDPIGFLQRIQGVVGGRLVISVPYVRASRVGLYYTGASWPADQPATIETVHVFELAPSDWRKVFLHSGWRVERELILKQFPDFSPLGWLMSVYWRYISFEGFYFVSLAKDDTFSSKYSVE